jgi:hypothetical protein
MHLGRADSPSSEDTQMYCRIPRFPAVVLIAWGLTAAWWVDVASAADKPKPLPSFEQIQELVLRHFALLPDYRPGNILAQSDVEPLFPQLQRLGWTLPNRKDVLRKIPADDSFLIRQLRTPRGLDFMRQIGSCPGAYDRLDRLSRLPQGRQTVHDLIYTLPRGYEMIQYMTTTLGGNELGKMLSKAPNGTDFNKPTGLIYTAEMLLDRLEADYAEAAKAARP